MERKSIVYYLVGASSGDIRCSGLPRRSSAGPMRWSPSERSFVSVESVFFFVGAFVVGFFQCFLSVHRCFFGVSIVVDSSVTVGLSIVSSLIVTFQVVASVDSSSISFFASTIGASAPLSQSGISSSVFAVGIGVSVGTSFSGGVLRVILLCWRLSGVKRSELVIFSSTMASFSATGASVHLSQSGISF